MFTNWLGLRGVIVLQASCRDEVILDLSDTRLVDHSTMEKLHELEEEFAHNGKRLTVIGLEAHVPLSPHPRATRKSGYARPEKRARPGGTGRPSPGPGHEARTRLRFGG